MESQGYHYSVLFVRTQKQLEMQRALSGAFPKSRGKIFLPMREYYRRDRKETCVKPLFPGYLFVYSDMGREELHRFLTESRLEAVSFLKELGMERKALEEGKGEAHGSGLFDLTKEESDFLDAVLDQDGVWRMSAGYRDAGGRVTVMEGPLTAFSDRIVRVDRHERVAYLDLKLREFDIIAGLEIKPKGSFLPGEKDTPAELWDGTKVDLEELKKRMMQA